MLCGSVILLSLFFFDIVLAIVALFIAVYVLDSLCLSPSIFKKMLGFCLGLHYIYYSI